MLSTVLWLALGSVSAAQAAPQPFEEHVQTWELGVVGARVDSLPQGDWFGGPRWEREGVHFRSAGDARDVRIQIVDDLMEGFEFNDLRFHLQPSGASVQVQHSSDVADGPLQDVGGITCLVTDGNETALEYEIYRVSGGYHVSLWVCAVSLHGIGRELALELARRQPSEERSPFDRLVHLTSLEDRSESHGYVDESGRKQGGWTLLQSDGRRLQVSWRDGVPHGPALSWDEKGRLRSLRGFRAGLMDGERIDWTEAGELYSCDTFVRDLSQGRRVVFHPSGAKKLEMEYVDGAVSGTIKKWSESGELIGEDKPVSFGSGTGDAAAGLARFDAQHARPKF